jgi:hypothetical protein
MRHARPDYDRIQDPLGKIPLDEPVFLLRAQDEHAPVAVRAYADAVEAAGGDAEIIRRSREQADRMDAWPTRKAPDYVPGTEEGPTSQDPRLNRFRVDHPIFDGLIFKSEEEAVDRAERLCMFLLRHTSQRSVLVVVERFATEDMGGGDIQTIWWHHKTVSASISVDYQE